MKLPRIERTAREALETAEYVYNSREVGFVRILDTLNAGTPYRLTLWCTGSIVIELAFFGDCCDVDVLLDDAYLDTSSGRIWRKEIEGLGRTRHILAFDAKSSANQIRLSVTAKGGLRI